MQFDIYEYDGKYVMHCQTEEEAKIFLNYLDSVDRHWCDGTKYTKKTYFNESGGLTCYYFNKSTYGTINCARDNGYVILEFSDFNWSNDDDFVCYEINDEMQSFLRSL